MPSTTEITDHRCPQCLMFARLVDAKPIMEHGTSNLVDNKVECLITIKQNCGKCGRTMKRAQLYMSEEVSGFGEHLDHHFLWVKWSTPETANRIITHGKDRFFRGVWVPGKLLKAKAIRRRLGACVEYEIRCSCMDDEDLPLYEGFLVNDVSPQEMERL